MTALGLIDRWVNRTYTNTNFNLLFIKDLNEIIVGIRQYLTRFLLYSEILDALNMPQSDNKLPDEISKSALKREMTALKKMGETLVDMSQSELDKIPLPDSLIQAITLAHNLKSREGKRRQLQFIGKLMRTVELEPIQAAIKNAKLTNMQVTAQFHQAEEWREQLINEGDDAVQAFVSLYTETDRQKLRQLTRQTQHNRKSGKDTGAEKMLFRYLRDIIK